MPSETRPEYLERKRKEVVEECMQRNVGTHSDAKEILKQYPEMLYFEENTHPGRTFEYRIVVRSPFVGVHSKTDKEVCDHVDPVVAMLKEFYNPLRVHVVVSSTVPKSCQGDRETHEENEFKTFLSSSPHPQYDKMALNTIRRSRFDSRSGTSASGIDLKSSSHRPREIDPGLGALYSKGGSKSRRTRRRKHRHNRKTHHKRKHHSRSRSRAARKHKKYSRRH